jgi:hypothetical protein
VAALAGFSLVLQTLQEDCVARPLSSKQMRMRHGGAGGVLLYDLRELEHLRYIELALRRLSVEERYVGGGIPRKHRPVEMA